MSRAERAEIDNAKIAGELQLWVAVLHQARRDASGLDKTLKKRMAAEVLRDARAFFRDGRARAVCRAIGLSGIQTSDYIREATRHYDPRK